MRLKHLELVGYKTFADRSQFQFDEGITAVIGPNGSGKSNVADAVRWVLGEQSLSLLRAKKSEDMIFSGSERRARLGMAEVTLTLDNSTNWLPIDFSEVAITRRSHRSGDNEYLLNGSRVRLRDIADLLGKSGLSKRTYTVIGQGLVDTALSLRPLERRKLIEEAAGLTSYQSRRADALNKLAETRQNVLRVHDLISEVAPRLRRLERQARRAQEYERIQGELDGLLRVWYSYRWRHGQEELHRVRSVSTYQLEQLEKQRGGLNELTVKVAGLRTQQSELRAQLGQWHRESSALHTRSEGHQRELAVTQERRRGLIQRRDELRSELAPLDAGYQDQLRQIVGIEKELAVLQKTLDQQLVLVNEARAALDAWQENVSGLRSERDQMQEKVISLRTEIADHQSRLSQLDERRSELCKARQAYLSSCGALEHKIGGLQGEIAKVDKALDTLAHAGQQVQNKRQAREKAIEAAQAQQQSLQQERAKVEAQHGRLRERYEVLTRMHQEGAGLYEGVRNVLRARSRPLHGILGTVAELIDVPAELEGAIEVALGGQLQDVVVQSWSDAQDAIDHLKRTSGGRATFLPLDTLRPRRPVRVSPREGVIGLASELVHCEQDLEPIVQYLLGRTIVCRDLTVARKLLSELQGSYQIVTPEGEQVRSSGAVTGGKRKRVQQGGMLARERERRGLPGQIKAVRAEGDRLDAESAAAVEEEKRLRDELAVIDAQQAKLDGELDQRRQARASALQQMDRAQNEEQWYRSLIEEGDRERAALDEREETLRQALADLEGQVATNQESLTALDDRLSKMDDQELNARLAEQREEMALVRQEQASKQAELRGLDRNRQEMQRQISSRRRRGEELKAALEDLARRIDDLRGQEFSLTTELQVFAEKIEPAESDLQELEKKQASLERQEDQVRQRLQGFESRYSQTQLRVARQEDQMEHLRSQIEDDLGLVDLEMGDDLSGQPLLPMGPMVSSLPEVEVLPEGIDEQIRSLKRRLNRLGPVNPEAPEEYRETLERSEFLTTQAQDLEDAATQLREVISELDEVMQREFRRTFGAVAQEFRAYFTRLFNGGSARLELTMPDDLMNTGIDIVARPPGKRQQGLAVLSGGERALTAAALIFAILTVSPTPFCVLDEVDAALDEANVGRFRNVLKELSDNTQFVVITHNRYTIEVSDIVYGISMGSDGASCVISHRMGKNGQDDEA